MTGVGAPCDDFRSHAVDLALGHVGEPARTQLLHHVRACASCDRLLDDLAAVSDRLLELAPEAEPPPGFEVATVERVGRRPQRRAPRPLAAAAVLIAALVGVVGGLALQDDESSPRQAVIVSRDGDRIGTVELQASSAPKLVLTMDGTSDWRGTWVCEVRASDGSWVEVGRWTADDVVNHVWAAGLPASLASTTSMRILGSSGAVIAVADLAAAGRS